MKYTKILGLAAFIAIFSSGLAISFAQPSAPSAIFSSIISQARQNTKIPIVLPSYINNEGGQPLYPQLKISEPSQYVILLGYLPDCDGRNVCHYSSFKGEKFIKNMPLNGIPVRLKNGATGYFKDAICQTQCSESTLTWRQETYQYTIGIKAGKKQTLIQIANSAM